MSHDHDDTLPGKRNVVTASELARGVRVRDYVVREKIAEGGFGAVYRVEHTVLGRQAALKVLHPELASSREAIARFEREARTVNVIKHPNVVDIYDFGELPDGRPYFVMELLVGIDLSEHLASFGPLSPEETLALLTPLAAALSAAHAKGVVHRDVKPSNVFLADGEPRRVVLLDFGVAKLLAPGTEGLTTSRHRIGTPSFMSPEQLAGGDIDGRADVYALGALAYQMLTGQLPFGEGTPAVLLHMHSHTRRPKPSDHVRVPEAVDLAVMTAMAIAREDRFSDPDEFVAALGRAFAAVHAAKRAERQAALAIALHIDVRIDPAVLEEADDALLADLDAALALANGLKSEFLVAAETGTSLLLARMLPADETAARGVRARAVDAARRLHAMLATRPSRDARVHVNMVLHVGQVLVVGDKVRGGDLTRLSQWVPDVSLEGVVATRAAIADVADAHAIAGHPALHRVA